jgi:ankyrin repeat protein
MSVLPEHADLRHLRDEAKHRRRSGEFPSLSAAQLAVAREYGFASWPRLKSFVETRALDRAARAAALVRSACSDDPRVARRLLEAQPGLGSYDLVTACVTGEVAAVAEVLDPAAVNERIGPLGWTPLLYTCFSRFLRTDKAADLVAVAALLLAAGADPNAFWVEHDYLELPVYGAAGIANNAALTQLLLEAGADPNETLTDAEAIGEALYHAVEFADVTCARLLLEAGTAQHKVTYCLGRALNFNRSPMVELLLANGAQPTSAHLQQAISKRRPLELIRSLLDAGAPVSQRALRLSVRWNRPDVAELLIERGADPVPVSAADAVPDADMLHEAVLLGDADLARRLLDAGLSPDAVSATNPDPALGSAAWRGYADVVRVLVSAGAALTWPEGSPIGAAMHGSQHCHDPQGGPMSLPVDEVRHGDYPGVVRILLDAGATIPQDYGGGSAEAAGILADLGVVIDD